MSYDVWSRHLFGVGHPVVDVKHDDCTCHQPCKLDYPPRNQYIPPWEKVTPSSKIPWMKGFLSFRKLSQQNNQPIVKPQKIDHLKSSRYTSWRHKIQEVQSSLPIADLFTCTDSSTKGKNIRIREVWIHEQEFEGLRKRSDEWWVNGFRLNVSMGLRKCILRDNNGS